ncbi:MAG: hypothetical protein CMF63_06710 [Magnetovibrio sp.]|nr:hypothetical protein [Magnetovibrio sp.]
MKALTKAKAAGKGRKTHSAAVGGFDGTGGNSVPHPAIKQNAFRQQHASWVHPRRDKFGVQRKPWYIFYAFHRPYV